MVNGTSLVGLTHQEAVSTLRSTTGLIQLVVASMVSTAPPPPALWSSNKNSNNKSNNSGLCCFRGSLTWALNTSHPAVFQTSSALVHHPSSIRLLPVPNIPPPPVYLVQTRYLKLSLTGLVGFLFFNLFFHRLFRLLIKCFVHNNHINVRIIPHLL